MVLPLNAVIRFPFVNLLLLNLVCILLINTQQRNSTVYLDFSRRLQSAKREGQRQRRRELNVAFI